MAITVYCVNAVSGAPAYSGRQIRQAMSALAGGATAARPLGGLSGIRPGTGPVVTVSTTQWTITPHSGQLDLEGASAGLYVYAVDSAVSGALTAANASNPRVDIVYLTLNDPGESDGSLTPAGVPGYLAGVAAAAPVAPPPPPRSLVLGQINVPTSGTGNPTASSPAPYAAAAGGIVPVNTLAELNALTPHEGKRAFCLYDGSDAVYSGGLWRYTDTREQSWAVSFGGWSNGGSGSTQVGHYMRQSNLCTVRAKLVAGGSGLMGNGVLYCNLPFPVNATTDDGFDTPMATIQQAAGNRPLYVLISAINNRVEFYALSNAYPGVYFNPGAAGYTWDVNNRLWFQTTYAIV